MRTMNVLTAQCGKDRAAIRPESIVRHYFFIYQLAGWWDTKSCPTIDLVKESQSQAGPREIVVDKVFFLWYTLYVLEGREIF